MNCFNFYLGLPANLFTEGKIFHCIVAVLGFLQGGDTAERDRVASENQVVGRVGVLNTRQVV